MDSTTDKETEKTSVDSNNGTSSWIVNWTDADVAVFKPDIATARTATTMLESDAQYATLAVWFIVTYPILYWRLLVATPPMVASRPAPQKTCHL